MLAIDIQQASNFLTNEIRAYVQFGEKEHYDNYWEEVNITKRRENAISRLEELGVPNEILNLARQAQQESATLAELEAVAMGYVAQENFERARELVFGLDYRDMQKGISRTLKNFLEQFESWTQTRVMEMNNSLNVSRTILFFALFLLIFASLFSSIMIFQKIRPLEKLSHVAQQIAMGDLRNKDFKVTVNDEIGSLLKSFSQMLEYLNGLILGAKGTSENVRDSFSDVKGEIVEMDGSVTEMDSFLNQLATDMDNQVVGLKESAVAMDNIASGIQQIAESSTSVSELATETSTQAHDGSAVIEKSVVQMETINQVVEDASGNFIFWS